MNQTSQFPNFDTLLYPQISFGEKKLSYFNYLL